MNRKALSVVAASILAASLATGGVALAGGEDQAEGPDVPIPAQSIEQASMVALDHLGEGRVTGTEVEDEESYYEVEVTLDDGTQVDVQLDEQFNVVGDEAEPTPDDD